MALSRSGLGVPIGALAAVFLSGPGCGGPEGQWGEARQIGDAGSAGAGPAVAFDGAGNAVAVWEQREAGTSTIRAARFSVGPGWSQTEVIGRGESVSDTLGHVGARPQVAVDEGGGALVVWAQRDAGRTGLWFNRFVVGRGWETPRGLPAGGDKDAFDPAIVSTGAGNALVAWATNDAIWAAEFLAGAGWSSPRRLAVDDTGFGVDHPSLAAGRREAALVWFQPIPTGSASSQRGFGRAASFRGLAGGTRSRSTRLPGTAALGPGWPWTPQATP